MSCERRGRRRPAGRRGPSALFMAHRCAARERTPASGHSQSLSPPKPVTGNAARRGGERVCGLVPVRATRPARGGATGSGCTEPNHGARWGVRAGRGTTGASLRGDADRAKKAVCARVSGRTCVRAVRVHAGSAPLFKSEWQRGTERTKSCTIPGTSRTTPPAPRRQSGAVGGKIHQTTPPPPQWASALVTQVSNP